MNEEWSTKTFDKDFNSYFPFPEARDGQREIIQEVLDLYLKEDKRAVVLCAPTAVGKSAIAVTVANYLGSSYLLTSQKQLQQQYMNDFERRCGMKLIKGKYNFQCIKNSKLKCDMGDCIGKTSDCGSKCPYTRARNSAYSSDLTVFNYAYFLNMTRSDFKHHVPRNFMILDECVRAGAMVLTLRENDLIGVPIEEIKVNDQIVSMNLETGDLEIKNINKTFKNLHKSQSYDHFLQIELEDGRIIEVTPNHKIYTTNRGYVRADELTEEDDIKVI